MTNNHLDGNYVNSTEDLEGTLLAHAMWAKGEGGHRADLSHANLSHADLSHADLRGANLHGANLIDAKLSHADLYHANLYHANLSGANLHGAKLSHANLRGANPSGADLRGADLRGANLHGANLRGADLRGANLYGANLSHADLSGAMVEGGRWEAQCWPWLVGNMYDAEMRTPGLVRIGCTTMSIEAWLGECGQAVAEEEGCLGTLEQQTLVSWLKMLRDVPADRLGWVPE